MINTKNQPSSGLNLAHLYGQHSTKQPGVAENLNDVELPKENTRKIREAIIRAQKDNEKLSKSLEEKMTELMKAQENNKSADKINAIKNEIHMIQCKLQMKVFEVRLEFYRMIRTIIQAYTDKKLLLDFKGAHKDTRHMTNFMRWHG